MKDIHNLNQNIGSCEGEPDPVSQAMDDERNGEEDPHHGNQQPEPAGHGGDLHGKGQGYEV